MHLVRPAELRRGAEVKKAMVADDILVHGNQTVGNRKTKFVFCGRSLAANGKLLQDQL